MSIAQQVATPAPAHPARRPSHPLRPVPSRRPVRALLGVSGLVVFTAVGVALTFGAVAIALVLLASNLAG